MKVPRQRVTESVQRVCAIPPVYSREQVLNLLILGKWELNLHCWSRNSEYGRNEVERDTLRDGQVMDHRMEEYAVRLESIDERRELCSQVPVAFVDSTEIADEWQPKVPSRIREGGLNNPAYNSRIGIDSHESSSRSSEGPSDECVVTSHINDTSNLRVESLNESLGEFEFPS